MSYILLGLTIGIAVAIGAVTGSYYGAKKAIEKKKFIVRFDKEKEEIHLEPLPQPGKVEYLPEATAAELREMDQDPVFVRFLKKFPKPEK